MANGQDGNGSVFRATPWEKTRDAIALALIISGVIGVVNLALNQAAMSAKMDGLGRRVDRLEMTLDRRADAVDAKFEQLNAKVDAIAAKIK